MPERWFDWSNLTIACDVCNTNKGNYSGDDGNLIDPYEMDPEDHLQCWGALILPRPGSDQGTITEKILKLNRVKLVERRTERLQNLLKHIEIIKRTNSRDVRLVLATDFCAETAASSEFAALCRYVLDTLRSELPELFSDPAQTPQP